MSKTTSSELAIIGIPRQGRHFPYHFNGDYIDMYRDETTGEVFEVIDP